MWWMLKSTSPGGLIIPTSDAVVHNIHRIGYKFRNFQQAFEQSMKRLMNTVEFSTCATTEMNVK